MNPVVLGILPIALILRRDDMLAIDTRVHVFARILIDGNFLRSLFGYAGNTSVDVARINIES